MTENNKLSQKKKIWLIAVILLVGFLAGFFLFNNIKSIAIGKSIDEKRQEFISQKEDIIGELIHQGEYACCLEKPCVYCIEKTPKHGQGATCHCLEDVVLGRHPCGECIGEILEGHGNKFLSQYFAQAIAEEVGDEHLESLKQIIAEKYGNNTCEINQTEECEK